jgi:hypothetical protein
LWAHGNEDFPLPEVREQWVTFASLEKGRVQEEAEAVEDVGPDGALAVGA